MDDTASTGSASQIVDLPSTSRYLRKCDLRCFAALIDTLFITFSSTLATVAQIMNAMQPSSPMYHSETVLCLGTSLTSSYSYLLQLVATPMLWSRQIRYSIF